MSVDAGTGTALKIMALRRGTTCACGIDLQAGERAAWNRETRTVHCLDCVHLAASGTELSPDAAASPPPIELGTAGGSAEAEYQRRHDRREAAVRSAHPRLGGLILALTDDPQTTRAWASGAVGERRLAEALTAAGDDVIALHDRRVPRSRANIDHIVVGPSGVFVVDARRYKGAAIRIRRTGGLLSPFREQLMVGGRDKTSLVEAMGWQVAAVRRALADCPDVSVSAVLCFVDGQFPLFGTMSLDGVDIRGPRGTATLVSREGPLDAAARDPIARTLAAALPAKAAETS